MTTATLPSLASPSSLESVDAQSLTHLHAHPIVAEALRKEFALRERLNEVRQAIQGTRQAIGALEGQEVMAVADQGTTWQPSAALREARQKLAGLLDEARMLDEAMPFIARQVQEGKDVVQLHLLPKFEALAQALMRRVIAAAAELQEALQEATSFSGKAYGVVGTHLAPVDLLRDPLLTGRLHNLHETLRTKFRWNESR